MSNPLHRRRQKNRCLLQQVRHSSRLRHHRAFPFLPYHFRRSIGLRERKIQRGSLCLQHLLQKHYLHLVLHWHHRQTSRHSHRHRRQLSHQHRQTLSYAARHSARRHNKLPHSRCPPKMRDHCQRWSPQLYVASHLHTLLAPQRQRPRASHHRRSPTDLCTSTERCCPPASTETRHWVGMCRWCTRRAGTAAWGTVRACALARGWQWACARVMALTTLSRAVSEFQGFEAAGAEARHTRARAWAQPLSRSAGSSAARTSSSNQKKNNLVYFAHSAAASSCAGEQAQAAAQASSRSRNLKERPPPSRGRRGEAVVAV